MAVKVKVCGISDIQTIEVLNKTLPDFVGFVFAPSRRQVSVMQAKEIISSLRPEILKVGVFVDQPIEYVQEAAQECRLDILQFHGKETNEYCSNFKQAIWKAIGVSSADDLKNIRNFNVDAIVLDSISLGACGGTGKVFDWDLAAEQKEKTKIVLAGGLNYENVMKAVNKVKPFCVDVSSGVETNGIKDATKIEEFIRIIRGM